MGAARLGPPRQKTLEVPLYFCLCLPPSPLHICFPSFLKAQRQREGRNYGGGGCTKSRQQQQQQSAMNGELFEGEEEEAAAEGLLALDVVVGAPLPGVPRQMLYY